MLCGPHRRNARTRYWRLGLAAATALAAAGLALPAAATSPTGARPLTIAREAVIATGNDWIALPEIRASDGAIVNFNAISMRDRGLLQVQGTSTTRLAAAPVDGLVPAVAPQLTVDDRRRAMRIARWQLIDDWIPVATTREGGVQLQITYATPAHTRTALLHMSLTNEDGVAHQVRFGLVARWGGLARVVYVPAMIRGETRQAPAAWTAHTQVFSFVENETTFAWALGYPDCAKATRQGHVFTSICTVKLGPHQTRQADFILSIGLDEFSAAYAGHVVAAQLSQWGDATVIGRERAWIEPRLRTTGNAALDELMNRNLLFSSFFAWGKALDTEQFVGLTSRSPRYYVSAAYWDRDAMLWSFPALLATDPARARRALDVAYGIQLRDAGTHSRFIDGVTLEPGYELDEGAAPIIALAEYWRQTRDSSYLAERKSGLQRLLAGLAAHRGRDGLYWTEQDSQDENRTQLYETYDNALVWRALEDAAGIYRALGDAARAAQLLKDAAALHAAVMKWLVAPGAPGASGPIFAFGWDGTRYTFDDVPPGSILKLPILGFVSETDAVFRRTYQWLHSKDFKYSSAGEPFGLPGSYRVPKTTCWSIADHLRLEEGRAMALKILLASPWDGGIVSEQVDPKTAKSIPGGGAFATAAGYVGAAICDVYCKPRPEKPTGSGEASAPRSND
ncbi:MAG TPA: glycoside hydrolase family 125 protein [Steroidobacteraceae bacterium]